MTTLSQKCYKIITTDGPVIARVDRTVLDIYSDKTGPIGFFLGISLYLKI